MITIINSETGNFLSVVNMLKKIGYETILTDDYDLISNSKVLIFPGVGNFDNVMNKIYEKKIDKEYFLKKMNWSKEKLNNYLKRPEKSHLSYLSEKKFYDFSLKIYNILKF